MTIESNFRHLRSVAIGLCTGSLLFIFVGASSFEAFAASDPDPDPVGEEQPATDILAELAPEIARKALSQISDTGRKLLALRSYLRIGSRIEARWSWTADEIKAFQGSEKQIALLGEIEAITKHFTEANPGYTLYVNTKVRSLNVQIEKWNRNASVGAAGEELMEAWRSKFGEIKPAQAEKRKLRQFLVGYRGKKRPYLAAPGLTLHGRASAIDFQIMQNGRIIAGANSRQITSMWEGEGWSDKLKQSISAVGSSFHGPLERPNEPWHYDYKPQPKESN